MLSASSLQPVSFRYDTTSGHTPPILATTSSRPGIESSFVMTALRNAEQDAIQSRVSVPFNRFTTNSVIENGSRLPNTDTPVRWRQRFIRRRSNMRYPKSLERYPLPRYLAKISAGTCRPSCRDRSGASGTAVSRFFPRLVASSVVLELNRLNIATQTRRNVDFSHVRNITQISAPRSSNSMLHCPCAFTRPKTENRMRGYIPLKMID